MSDARAGNSGRGTPIPVILDCDPGHDDAMAIMLAAAHPALDLKAVTTVAGNQTLDKTTLNARRIATAAGIKGIPVAAGCDRPLSGPPILGDYIHGPSGLDGPAFGDVEVPLDERHGVALMRDLLTSSQRPVTMIATGPMTNIATLLRDHPEVTEGIAEIVFMGGSTDRGNFSPYAEFNIAADPEAAAIVVGSGLPVTMCGLNVTHQVLVSDTVLGRLRDVDTPLAALCVDLVTFFARTYRDVFGFEYPPLHDPLAVARVIDPSLVTCEPVHVAIETNGEHTRGATVVDLHGRTGSPANVQVAVGVDVEGFWDLMIGAIRALG